MKAPAATFYFVSVVALASWLSASDLADPFTGRTMRVDYFHTGKAGEETIAISRIRVEGPWPGNPRRAIDTTGLGKYRFEVVDRDSQEVLYSRGFASIFGEWETTGEARQGVARTFAEAWRFPEPQKSVQIRLYRRDAMQRFQSLWSGEVDPSDRSVWRGWRATGNVHAIIDNGPPSSHVDLAILGDGYTAEEMAKFRADAARAAEQIFRYEPFASRRRDFNVWAVESPAVESGIPRPRSGLFRDPPLGTSYNTFDSERYVLTVDDRAWRDVASAAPYDFVLILLNSEKYGGGGIFNLYSTAAADSSFNAYLVVHEFGHHFAGLGDEYYTSDVAYEGFQQKHLEPWEPNITALIDPDALKWRHLVDEGVPIPTPWVKEEFEARSRELQEQRRELRESGAAEPMLEALFESERLALTKLLSQDRYAGRTGAFEGASYEATGLYRPSVDCLMFTRDEIGFCSVCREAIEKIIDLYSR